MNRKYKLNIGNFQERGDTFYHEYPNRDRVEITQCDAGYGFDCAYYKKGDVAPVKSLCTDIEEYSESELFPGCSMLQGEALNKAVTLTNQLTKQYYEA